MLILILTGINLLWLVLAHLNVWLPITFSRLLECKLWYRWFVINVIVGVATFRAVRQLGRPILPTEIIEFMYEIRRVALKHDDIVESIRLEYRMNWLSFFLYEGIICLSLS